MPLVLAGATSGSATVQATDAATVTLTLPGTSGTLVSTGSIPAAGSNTQVQYNSSGTLAGSSKFVFDGSNVGIGTTSPSGILHTFQTGNQDSTVLLEAATAGYASNFFLQGNNAAGSRYNNIASRYGTTYQWQIGGGGTDGNIVFKVGSGLTEALRIDSSADIFAGGSTIASATKAIYSSTTAKAFVQWNGASGAINQSKNVSSVTRNTTGNYTVNFSFTWTTNYAIVFGGSRNNGRTDGFGMNLYNQTATAVNVDTSVSITAYIDAYSASIVCFA